MRNQYICTRSDEYILEHADNSFVNTGRYDSAYSNLQTQKKEKQLAAARQKASLDRKNPRGASGDTTNHSSEIKAKWQKLIDQQQATIDKNEAAHSQAKTDYDKYTRAMYGVTVEGPVGAAKKAQYKAAAQNAQQKMKQATANIAGAKKAIASYKTQAKQELAQEAARYKEVMARVAY